MASGTGRGEGRVTLPGLSPRRGNDPNFEDARPLFPGHEEPVVLRIVCDAVQYRFVVNEDKLKRMIFQGDYNRVPAAVGLVRQRTQP